MFKKSMRFLTLSLLGLNSMEADGTMSPDTIDKIRVCVNLGVILLFVYLGFGIANLQALNLNIADASL